MQNSPQDSSRRFLSAIELIKNQIKHDTLCQDDIETALTLSPDTETFSSLSIYYFKAGNIGVAERLTRAALRHYPNSYDILNTLGVILKSKNCFEEAVYIFQKATLINPYNAHAWINMGNVFYLMEKYKESLYCFMSALEHNPNHMEAMRLKAIAHAHMGAYDIAINLLLKLVTIEPHNINVIVDLCAAYYNNMKYSEVIVCVDNYLEIFPNNTNLLTLKAWAMARIGMEEEAIAALEKGLQYRPDDIDLIFNLGTLYLNTNQNLAKSKECYTRAYNSNPDNPKFLLSLCSILSLNQADDGDLDQAHQLTKKLIKLYPSTNTAAEVIQRIALKTMDYQLYTEIGNFKDINTYWAENKNNTSLLFQMGQVTSMEDRYDLLAAHRIWGTDLESTVNKTPINRKVRQRLNNKVRLGILSVDLKNNNVGRFIWPLLTYLDKSKFELHCYALSERSHDVIEDGIINNSDSFQLHEGTDSTAIAQSIAEDSVDMLIEISAWHRTYLAQIIAHKPAKIQISWLDYPNSIGLPTAIDYIVTDPYIKPEDPTLLIEKQLIMPHTWVSTCAELFARLDINTSLPQDRNGYITFGTMNSVHKLNIRSLKVWAEIMSLFPNSKFLYVRPETSSTVMKNNFCKYMNGFGINTERILFVSTKTEHLKYYNEIDVAFDTFPHTGGTTTCEALWMGVPVVSLVGPAFFERISYSNLSNCGLGDLCAFDLQQYENIAISLAHDKQRRSYLRHNMRQQIIQNPLGKPQDFAKDFGNSLLNIWGK